MRSLEHLFEVQSRLTPERTALVEGARSITYAELESRSACAAAALRSHGISEGSLVGLHIDRSIDWAAGVLAILRAGGVVMPLPPNYPSARLRDILARAEVQAVIQNRTTPLDIGFRKVILDFDDLCRAPAVPSVSVRDVVGEDVDRAAFVLCSSGSTGSPKMIVRSHRSFMHRLEWTWSQHPFLEGEVGCHKAHTTTTHGIYELFEPLLRGASTLVLPDEDVRDLERFWSIVSSGSVTRLLIVPSAMKASLDIPGFSPPPLKVVVLMGEHLHSGLAQRIVAAFPQSTRLYSIYGSTEASSTLVCDLRESTQPGRDLPLGRPIASDIGVHVLDHDLGPVAPGETGRLYISGPALFAGYLGNPDLTSSVVFRCPLGGERLYDTRDDVRRAPDGELMFVGRMDDTVKIRGFRVELSEIERAICSHPRVTQAAVLATGGETGQAGLAGFFTPRDVPAGEIYGVLRDRLPPYMLPSTLIGLDVFPLTERSKLDRKRLLAEQFPRMSEGFTVTAMSATEERVARAWEQTLGHRRFDPESSFFEVGGTSLTTSVLVSRLRAEFGLDRERLPEQFAYRFQTIATMAKHLEGGDEKYADDAVGGDSILVTLRRAVDSSVAPLFLIASAGGTVGAYQKVASRLRFSGEILGVRDPFIDGDRDPTEDFGAWVGRYLAAIRRRHPRGPYYLAAYSSAGVFGYELALRLRREGAEVGLLALIDTLGMGSQTWRDFGWWSWRAIGAHPWQRGLIRFAALLRRPAAGLLRSRAARSTAKCFALSRAEFQKLSDDAMRARGRHLTLATLMELNTGLPLDLIDVDIPAEPPESALLVLQDRAMRLLPGIDHETIRRVAIQYPLQLAAQCAYELRPLDAPVLLVEPESPHAGLIEAQLKPLLCQLQAKRLKLGAPDARTRAITARFGDLAPHFRSMRDDTFANALARELDAALDAAIAAAPNRVSG